MYPLLVEDMARDMIRTLHRQAAAERLATQVRRARAAGRARPARMAAVRRRMGRLLVAVGARLAGVAVTVSEASGSAGSPGR